MRTSICCAECWKSNRGHDHFFRSSKRGQIALCGGEELWKREVREWQHAILPKSCELHAIHSPIKDPLRQVWITEGSRTKICSVPETSNKSTSRCDDEVSEAEYLYMIEGKTAAMSIVLESREWIVWKHMNRTSPCDGQLSYSMNGVSSTLIFWNSVDPICVYQILSGKSHSPPSLPLSLRGIDLWSSSSPLNYGLIVAIAVHMAEREPYHFQLQCRHWSAQCMDPRPRNEDLDVLLFCTSKIGVIRKYKNVIV